MAVNLIHEMETLIKFSKIQYLYTFACVEFFYEALTEKKSWCENKNDEKEWWIRMMNKNDE